MNTDLDHVPEDDDPAYNNPVGKIPRRVRQPFDFDVTLLHSESEREQIKRELAEATMPEIHTRQMKKTSQWLDGLRRAAASVEMQLGLAKNEKDIADLETKLTMYDEAADLWAVEVTLFLKDLRLELADRIESKYPTFSQGLAQHLRDDDP